LRDREILFDTTCFRIGFKFPPLGLKGGILPLTADGITNPRRVFGTPGGVSVVLIFWGSESPSLLLSETLREREASPTPTDTLRDRGSLFLSLFCPTGCTLRLFWRRLLA